MALSRRALIRSAAASLLAAPSFLTASVAGAAITGQPLRLPPLDPGRIEDGARVFDLSIAPGQTEFFNGTATETIGINGPFLGPQLQINAGDVVRMNVTNALSEEAALHWHGMHLPAAADGGPHQPIAPGETWQPSWTMMQKAGTFWYHGHMHGKTGAHVWAGMAGVIRVEDDEEAALPLPRTYGEDDFTLILQDRRFASNGLMPYEPNMHDQMAGMQGDVFLVNGQINPVLTSGAPRLRLRILNGSNGSFYRLHLTGNAQFHQIASDGGLLAAPVPLTEALMAPGERAEYLVDMTAGARQLLAEVFGAEVAMMGSRGAVPFLDLMPTGSASSAPMPATLALLETPPVTGSPRRLDLSMSGRGMMGNFLINGVQYDHHAINFSIPLGSTEIWTVTNTTPMIHPIHIHDVQFRILTRNGQPPAPREAGLKDVVVVGSMETVELAMSFTDFADPDLPYMYHCHILEHEDAGMMGQFTVI